MSMVTVSKVDSSIKYIPFWDPWLGTRESVHVNSVVTDGDLKLEPNDRRVQEQTTLEHMRLKTCTACGSWSLMLNFVSSSVSPNPQIVLGMFGIWKSTILQASCSLLNSGMSTSLQHSIDFNSPFRSSCIESKISEGYMFCIVLHVSQKLLAMEKANSSKGCSMNKHSKSQSLWGSGRTFSCFVPSSRNSEKTRICWLRPIGISWTFT